MWREEIGRNRLQFITHTYGETGYVEGAMKALEGGCRWIQLRIKEASDGEVEKAAKTVLRECRRKSATLIIDDRVDLAMSIGADGVHLGNKDMPIAEARRIMGTKYIIGGTANTVDDLRRIVADGGDYAGCGPFRFTETKRNLAPELGLEGMARLAAWAKGKIPVVAIGGIEPDDIPYIMSTGVWGVAISGYILRSGDPVRATESIIGLLGKERGNTK